MTPVARLVRVVLAFALLSGAGCGRAQSEDTVAGEASSTVSRAERASSMTMVEIVSGTRIWTVRIEDGPASREFLTQLPLKLTLSDFGGNEKIADLPRPLTPDGAPDAITPRAGDVAFYAPWGNLAIFYGDGNHSPGLIRLGRIEGDWTGLAGAAPLTVTMRRAEGARN